MSIWWCLESNNPRKNDAQWPDNLRRYGAREFDKPELKIFVLELELEVDNPQRMDVIH